MAQDAKQPNRKSIAGLDTRSNKAHKATLKHKARAAELGITFDEYFNKTHQIMIMFLKQEITFSEYEKMIAELEGKAGA